MKKDITYFGEVEINSPQETTEWKVTIDNLQIELDLNFYNGVPKYDWVAEYENYIKDLKFFWGFSSYHNCLLSRENLFYFFIDYWNRDFCRL